LNITVFLFHQLNYCTSLDLRVQDIIKAEIPEMIPIEKNNQPSGIKKNGSTKVPSGRTSEPIILKETIHTILIKIEIKDTKYFLYFFMFYSNLLSSSSLNLLYIKLFIIATKIYCFSLYFYPYN